MGVGAAKHRVLPRASSSIRTSDSVRLIFHDKGGVDPRGKALSQQRRSLTVQLRLPAPGAGSLRKKCTHDNIVNSHRHRCRTHDAR